MTTPVTAKNVVRIVRRPRYKWIPLKYHEAGKVAEFVVLVRLKAGADKPTEEEVKSLATRTITLDNQNPLPAGSLVN